MRKDVLVLAVATSFPIAVIILSLGAEFQPVQEFSRSVGLVFLTAKIATGSTLLSSYPTTLLGRLVNRNFLSQELVRDTGSLQALLDQLQVDHSNKASVAARVKTLARLIQGNGVNKDLLHRSGGIPFVVNLLQEGPSSSSAAAAAHVLAALTSGKNATQYRAALHAGKAAASLLMCLDGGADSKGTLYATWALGNLLVDSPSAQDEVLRSGSVETLGRLLWEGPDHPITPAAVHAVANLAANSKQAQHQLVEAGVVEPLVKLVEAGPEGRAGQDSDTFKAEVVQHLLTLQVSHPQLREAIQEVGGVDQLLELVETGVGLREEKTRNYPVAIYYGEEDAPEVEDEMVQGLAGMRRLVQTLQDQLDSSSSSPPAPADTTPTDETVRQPSSHAQAFALETVRRFTRERVAAKAAWALANIAANNREGQDTIRQAGGVEPLVSLLQGASDKRALKSASWALANLAKSNSDNKAAIREAKGIQGMVKLLAANPADQEVVKEVARALKFMAAERSLPEQAQQRGRALLSRWSRRISFLLHDNFELNVKDSVVSSALIAFITTSVAAMLLVVLKYLFF